MSERIIVYTRLYLHHVAICLIYCCHLSYFVCRLAILRQNFDVLLQSGIEDDSVRYGRILPSKSSENFDYSTDASKKQKIYSGSVLGRAFRTRSQTASSEEISNDVVPDNFLSPNGGGMDMSMVSVTESLKGVKQLESVWSASLWETDDLFVLNLVGEAQALLASKNTAVRSDILHILSELMIHRKTAMESLLVLRIIKGDEEEDSEITPVSSSKGSPISTIDIFNGGGFEVLAGGSEAFEKFNVWLDLNREKCYFVLEAAALRSTVINPTLATELPGMAVIKYIRPAAVRVTFDRSEDRSEQVLLLGKFYEDREPKEQEDLIIPLTSKTAAYVFPIFRRRWQLSGASIIERGRQIYEVLLNSIMDRSLLEGPRGVGFPIHHPEGLTRLQEREAQSGISKAFEAAEVIKAIEKEFEISVNPTKLRSTLENCAMRLFERSDNLLEPRAIEQHYYKLADGCIQRRLVRHRDFLKCYGFEEKIVRLAVDGLDGRSLRPYEEVFDPPTAGCMAGTASLQSESGSSTSNSHDNEEINHNGLKIQSEGNYEEGGRGRNGGSTKHISKESNDGIFGTQTDIEISGKIGIDHDTFPLRAALLKRSSWVAMPERDMFDDEEEEEEQEGEDQQSKSGAQNNREEQQVGNVETVHGQMGKDSEGSQGDQDIKQPNLSIGSPSTTLSYTPAPRAAAALDMIQTTQNELDCLSATALPSVMSNNISGAEEASMAAEMAMAAADGLASLRGLIRNKDYPIERALNVSQIKGLDAQPMLLLIAQNALYVLEGYSVPDGAVGLEKGVIATTEAFEAKSKKSSAVELPATTTIKKKVRLLPDKIVYCESAGSSYWGTVMMTGEAKNESDQDNNILRLPFERFYRVFKRRHQLRMVALEIFDILNQSILLAFDVEDRADEILGMFLNMNLKQSLNYKYGIGSTSSSSSSSASPFSSISSAKAKYKAFMSIHKKTIQKRWISGAISNLEYLIEINLLAGRSFCNFAEYPIFPWVLADYTSENIDLTSPTSFRDLSKPMGRLGEVRSRAFCERYDMLSEMSIMDPDGGDDQSTIRPFHYGSYLSCSGFVLGFCMRLEPYARFAIELQGGKFDKADRLFRSIGASWQSASSQNLQDVRELIPGKLF